MRDSDSFRILSEALPNRILLVPDMAFCIDTDTLKPWHRPWGRRILYARRLDKEMPADLDVSAVPANARLADNREYSTGTVPGSSPQAQAFAPAMEPFWAETSQQ